MNVNLIMQIKNPHLYTSRKKVLECCSSVLLQEYTEASGTIYRSRKKAKQ